MNSANTGSRDSRISHNSREMTKSETTNLPLMSSFRSLSFYDVFYSYIIMMDYLMMIDSYTLHYNSSCMATREGSGRFEYTVSQS
jgi:hypothetical protein